MKTILLTLILVSCATKVPISYRHSDNSYAPKGTPLAVTFDQHPGLSESAQKAILARIMRRVGEDGWWSRELAPKKPSHELRVHS